MRTYLLCIFLLITNAATVHAQDIAVKWSGEVKARGEIDGRDFLNRTPLNAYTFLRTRLGVDVSPSANVRLLVQLQDSRVFGQFAAAGPANSTANLGNLDLHQGYLRLDSLFQTGLSVSLGRMELSYANQRILGAAEWSNVGRSLDGALVRYRWDANTMDIFSMNVTEYSTPPTNATPASTAGVGGEGFLLSGLWYSGSVTEKFTLDGFLLYEWSRKSAGSPEGELSRATLGAYGRGSAEQFFYEAEAAYQFGDIATKTIGAYLLSGTLGYKLANSPLASVSLSYDFLSGSADTAKFKTFHAPFHTGHKFYGFMDYFINIPGNTLNRGLQDLILKVTLKPSESATLNLWFHNFSMADKGTLPSGTFGQEIDVTSSISYTKNVSFELGVSAFVPGDILRTTFRGSDVAWWGYGTARVWF